MSIEHLGWNEQLEHSFASFRSRGLSPARIACEDRERYVVLHADGEDAAVVAGRLRNETTDRVEFPTVGDWVALRPRQGDGPFVIESVLPRASVFIRKSAGEVTEPEQLRAPLEALAERDVSLEDDAV